MFIKCLVFADLLGVWGVLDNGVDATILLSLIAESNSVQSGLIVLRGVKVLQLFMLRRIIVDFGAIY